MSQRSRVFERAQMRSKNFVRPEKKNLIKGAGFQLAIRQPPDYESFLRKPVIV